MKNYLIIMFLGLLQLGCSSDNPITMEPPSSAQLVFPLENSLCNVGTNVTSTMSTVQFEWKPSANTDSYTLVIKNISDEEETEHQTINTELSISIKRATQFQWYVISHSKQVSETAESIKWHFYNSGEGIQSFAPFPAEIITPEMTTVINPSATQINLIWNGSDIDNDIVWYDIYLGTTTSPELYMNAVTDSFINNVPIQAETIYYWKVITEDSKGNTSDSGLYQFKNL